MSTAIRKGGLTLAEVLVSFTLFIGLMAMLFLCERMSLNSQTKTTTNSDAYRMAMGAMERIKTEVRGAYVVAVNTTTSEIDYRVPVLDANGYLVDDGTGHAVWDPPDPEVTSITLDAQGNIIKTKGGIEYHLGYLGPLGTLTFTLPDLTGDDVVKVGLHAQLSQPGDVLRTASYDLNFTLLFPNQR